MGLALGHNDSDAAERRHDPSWAKPIDLRFWLLEEGGHWIALVEQFDVVGQGPTMEAAFSNVNELLDDYLRLVAEEGGSVDDARRPIPLAARARLHARRVLSAGLHRALGQDGGSVHSQVRRERLC